MPIIQILAHIDAEIARLQQARALLASEASVPSLRGRKVGVSRKKKRNLTPEGRARIAAAVKRRWAAQKAKQK